MDPIHLENEELDYEMNLRGVYNLSTARQKTHCLKEFLKREEMGESVVKARHSDSLNPTIELARCVASLNSVAAVMQQPDFGEFYAPPCRSRLMHIMARSRRIRPVTPEEQTAVADIMNSADVLLAELSIPELVERSPPRSTLAGAAEVAPPLSPLVDIIQRISQERHSNREEFVFPQAASDREDNAPPPRQTLLNPDVPDFRPRVSTLVPKKPTPFDRGAKPREQRHDLDELFGVQGNDFRNATFQPTSRAEREMHSRVQQQRAHPVRVPSPVSSDSERDFSDRTFSRGRRAAPAPRRRTVPIHQWRVTYSGDGKGLHLYDFLSELKMLQRSERASDEDLFESVMHLLSGPARRWYRSWFDTLNCWADFVAAIKIEFLPPQYDYRLLSSISSRRQKPTETFAEYLDMMQTFFKYLSIPIDDRHKLCILEENMLAKYAVAVAAVEIQSMKQLANVCRRIDFAYNRHSQNPLDAFFSNTHTPLSSASRPSPTHKSRDVHEMSAFEDAANNFAGLSLGNGGGYNRNDAGQAESAAENECMEIRRNGNRPPPPKTATEGRKCFNCGRDGHNFADCRTPKRDQFCFRCGSRDVTMFTCKNCPKNEGTDPARRERAPGPAQN